MKKFKSKKMLGSFFALLAGAMLTFAGCDSGNDEYAEEYAPTFYELSASVNDADVTAIWGNYEKIASISEIGTTEQSYLGTSIAPTSGSGATLVAHNEVGFKYNKGLQGKKNSTASVAEPENGPALKLTLSKPSSFTVKAKGAGGADLLRIIVITDANGTELVYKENLNSNNVDVFAVKNAPAGDYIIYFNGSKIMEIDCSVKSDELTKPDVYSKEQIAFTLSDEIEVYDIVKTAGDGYNMKRQLIWWSTDESVATVKEGVVTGVGVGTAKICARSGKNVVSQDVTVKPNTKTYVTFFDASKLPTEAVKSPYDKAQKAYKYSTATWEKKDYYLWDEVDLNVNAIEKTTYMVPMATSGADYEKFGAAFEKCLEPVIIGDLVSATDADMGAGVSIPRYNLVVENKKIGDYGLPTLQPKMTSSTTAAGKFGLSWKDGYMADDVSAPVLKDSYKGTANDNILTLTTTITPKSGATVKLAGIRAIMACGQTDKTSIAVTASGSSASIKSQKTGDFIIASFATPVDITTATDVSIVISQGETFQSSNSIQDIALVFTK